MSEIRLLGVRIIRGDDGETTLICAAATPKGRRKIRVKVEKGETPKQAVLKEFPLELP